MCEEFGSKMNAVAQKRRAVQGRVGMEGEEGP